MDLHLTLLRDQCPITVKDFAIMKDKPYSGALGLLNYGSVATHPNIMYVCLQPACYQDTPSIVHWNVLKHVYQCLKGTLDLELVLGGQGLQGPGWLLQHQQHVHQGMSCRLQLHLHCRSRCHVPVVQTSGPCHTLDHGG
jgi:hypothetical protein